MDEAERCHRLAILDEGAKVADGTPAELQAATGMYVVEVTAEEPYAAQAVLAPLREVASVTQLGVRLRVLLPEATDDPIRVIESALANAGLEAVAEPTRPSLEDVFVAVTGRTRQEAA